MAMLVNCLRRVASFDGSFIDLLLLPYAASIYGAFSPTTIQHDPESSSKNLHVLTKFILFLFFLQTSTYTV